MTTDASTAALNALISRLQAGDPTARRELVSRSVARLHRLARHILKNFPAVQRWEDAEDVAQNASLQLLRTLEAVTPDSASGYFRLAAREIRRELLDLARHYGGPQGVGAAHASVGPDGFSSTAFTPANSGFDPQRLPQWTEFHRLVEAMPPEEREVFDLLWYHETTQEEAAAILGVSLATLKGRWVTARIRLQTALHDASETG